MNETLVIIFAGGLSWEDHTDSPLLDADAQAVEKLLVHLKNDGLTQISLCAPESLKISIPDDLRVRRLDDKGISGTLGCVFREVIHWDCSKVVILNGRMLCPPRISELIEHHEQSDVAVTLFRDPFALDFNRCLSPVYICDRELFERVPEVAYSDLKEGLLSMLKGECRVVHLEQNTGRYSTLEQYRKQVLSTMRLRMDQAQGVDCKATDAKLTSPGRICGDAWLEKGAVIEEGAVIIGPACINEDAKVDAGAVVCRSVVQKGGLVRSGEVINNSVVDNDELHSGKNRRRG